MVDRTVMVERVFIMVVMCKVLVCQKTKKGLWIQAMLITEDETFEINTWLQTFATNAGTSRSSVNQSEPNERNRAGRRGNNNVSDNVAREERNGVSDLEYSWLMRSIASWIKRGSSSTWAKRIRASCIGLGCSFEICQQRESRRLSWSTRVVKVEFAQQNTYKSSFVVTANSNFHRRYRKAERNDYQDST